MQNEKYMKFFKNDGDFRQSVDPYRKSTELSVEFRELFFDSGGYLTYSAKAFLQNFVEQPTIKPMCDAVQILVANRFAGCTHGNYSTIFYWR